MRQSCADTLAPEEPDALIAHVRVCGGAGWVTIGSTRKPTSSSLRCAPAFGRGSPLAFGCIPVARRAQMEPFNHTQRRRETHEQRTNERERV
jgi:hypothetical protein